LINLSAAAFCMKNNYITNNSIAPKTIIVKTSAYLLIALAILFITIITCFIFIYYKGSMDQYVFEAIRPHITNARTDIMIFISFFGNSLFLIPANLLLIIFYIFKKNRWLAVTVFSIALSSLSIMSILKNLIKRSRPDSPLVQGITNFSLPSGHAIMSVTFFGLLIWLEVIHITNKWIRGIVVSFLSILILLICFSRIYLRVHYTTDVIAGLAMGLFWLIVCLWIINRIELRMINNNNNASGFVNKP